MPHTGTLRDWNDDRGFGFIAPTDGGREVFVHISAFPSDGSRPVVGERVTYELGPGRDGKPQALAVRRTAVGARTSRHLAPAAKRANPTNWLGVFFGVLVLLGAAAFGLSWYRGYSHRLELEALPPTTAAPPGARPAAGSFQCDGRIYCSQMTSCAEAKWFINNCPGTRMDGNHDGTPCQEQWCGGIMSK